MRVLALVTDAYGGYGGIAQYNRDFMGALSAMDGMTRIDVFPRIASEPDRIAPNGITVHRPLRSRAAYSLRVALHALTHPPDIVFNGHIYHSPLSGLIARWTGAKLLSQLHGTEIWRPVSASILSVLRRSEVVFCVSADTRARYLKQIGSTPDNSTVLHNTIGEAFCPGDRNEARSGLGLDNEFVLLSVGRLDSRGGGYKGHGRVIRALAGLKTPANVPILYLIAGDGDDRPRLQALAQRCGVADRVRFLGKVPGADLSDLYRAADLFALPSTGEGFGIVYLEAMACGTPAIGLDVGGVSDAFLDGHLRWCVEDAAFEARLQDAVLDTSLDRDQLAKIVRSQFGRGVFDEKVKRMVRSMVCV